MTQVPRRRKTGSAPCPQATRLAARQLQAGGSALTRKQVSRALHAAARRLVPFPGLNAPPPAGADIAAWAVPAEPPPGGEQVGIPRAQQVFLKVCPTFRLVPILGLDAAPSNGADVAACSVPSRRPVANMWGHRFT